MKKLILLVGLIALVASLATAQVGSTYRTVQILGTAVGDTSINSVFDTTSVFQVGAYPYVTMEISSSDRINLTNVHIYKKEAGMSTFAVVDSLVAWAGSTNGVTNTKEFALRDGVVDKLPGVRAQYWARLIYAGSNNDNARVTIRIHMGGI